MSISGQVTLPGGRCTVKNFVFDVRTAASASGGTVSCTLGALRVPCAPIMVHPDTGVFAAAWPTPGAGSAIQLQNTPQKYQDMTRFGAADGSVSGSHPAWDPV
jgi:hypothetical protein